MDQADHDHLPLASLEDMGELTARYRIFSDAVLLKWMEVVTGPHREAMAAVLREREEKREIEPIL